MFFFWSPLTILVSFFFTLSWQMFAYVSSAFAKLVFKWWIGTANNLNITYFESFCKNQITLTVQLYCCAYMNIIWFVARAHLVKSVVSMSPKAHRRVIVNVLLRWDKNKSWFEGICFFSSSPVVVCMQRRFRRNGQRDDVRYFLHHYNVTIVSHFN